MSKHHIALNHLATVPWFPLPEEDATKTLRPIFTRIMRSKLFRILTLVMAFLVFPAIVLLHREMQFSLAQWYSNSDGYSSNGNLSMKADIDWSEFAYIQYASDAEYLCNSVMIFESLNRLGSKADRVLMYPYTIRPDVYPNTHESRLLLKAQREYGAKLIPIEVPPNALQNHAELLAFSQTQYERVLILDSSTLLLQHLDELFLLPPSPIAMPLAYWLPDLPLSPHLQLIQPSASEFRRRKHTLNHAKSSKSYKNMVYGTDSMILPHRPYNLLTSEFRLKSHTSYLGTDDEEWNPVSVLEEAKLVHFSDSQVPKPWLATNLDMKKGYAPCSNNVECLGEDMWNGFYRRFREQRNLVCKTDMSEESLMGAPGLKRPLDREVRKDQSFELWRLRQDDGGV